MPPRLIHTWLQQAYYTMDTAASVIKGQAYHAPTLESTLKCVYIYIYIYIYIYMCVCVCVCVCIYIHTHIYVYTSTPPFLFMARLISHKVHCTSMNREVP